LLSNFWERVENNLLTRRNKFNSNIWLKIFVQRPAAMYNTDARRHSMEEMKIISESGNTLHLSRVSCDSRPLLSSDPYLFKNNVA
jgi:hypothetical protein